MPETSHSAIDLDVRLAEIDSRLQEIQAELAPEQQQPSPASDWQPAPAVTRQPAPAAERHPARGGERELAPPAQRQPTPAAEAQPAGPAEPAPEKPPAPPAMTRAQPTPPVPAPETRTDSLNVPKPDPRPSAEPAARSERRRSGRSGPLASLLARSAQQPATLPREEPTPGSRVQSVSQQAQEGVGQREAEQREGLDELATLTDLHVRLLTTSNELLTAYRDVIERLRSPEPEPEPIEVTVDAGPFMSLEAVRDFERALATLPGTIDVAVRGYERGNRAIVDVQLQPPRP